MTEKEIQDIIEENKYLKKILNQHGISFSLPKKIEDLHLENIDSKIDLYLSYFNGRPDVFAFQYISKKDNKKGYAIACENRRDLTGYCDKKCKDCETKKYVGLNKDIIKRHLSGKELFGIYPILENDMCNFLVFDFDDKNYRKNAISFKNICSIYKIDAGIEISQSGSGAHVWIFFKSSIKASKARKLGFALLNKAIDECDGINYDSFDRMFPSQDTVPKNGFGNLIALPLQGDKAKEGKSLFVDDNFVPYPLNEQINYIGNLKKISETEIDFIMSQLSNDDETSLLDPIKNIKVFKSDFPNNFEIVL